MGQAGGLSDISGAKVVVTGAAGFIGSHLCRRLVGLEVGEVVALDHLRFGDWGNLRGAEASGVLYKLTLDFSEPSVEELSDLLQGTRVLFHLAAEKHNQSLDEPQRVLDVNVSGTFRLFEAAAQAGVEKIVFTSSLYAYGRHQGRAMRETDVPEPWTVYGVSKLAGEKLLRGLERKGVDCTSLRLFFVYGPGQFAGKGYKSVIVSNFERILAGEAPTVCGDGEQSLDYVYVDDVVDALIRAAERRGVPGPYNIGSGRAIPVNALTQQMLRTAGSSLAPVHVDPDSTAGSVRVSDCSLAKRDLEWEPRVSLEKGLVEVCDWMKSGEHSW